MWELSTLSLAHIFSKPDDSCKKMVCLRNKPLLVLLGSNKLNVFDFQTLKNKQRIFVKNDKHYIFDNFSFFCRVNKNFLQFINLLTKKTKYMFSTSKRVLNVFPNKSLNSNILSLFNKSLIWVGFLGGYCKWME